MTVRPGRFGYVLRRLAAGKTTAVGFRVAGALAEAGYVTIDDPTVKVFAVKVTITEAGRELAKSKMDVAGVLGAKPQKDRRR